MLEVSDVWHQSGSVFFGYQAVALDSRYCAHPAGEELLSPSCGQPFPWILGSATNVTAIMADAGVTKISDGTIRGHDVVPAGTVIDPQEIREKVLYLDRQAQNSIFARFAKTCAKPFNLAGVSGYRTKIRSLDTGKDIDAFLVVSGHGLIWMEFDETGWTEAKYPAILKKAVQKAQV
jgi:hypothetical protein